MATPGFYPGRKVEGEYVEKWTLVMEHQLQLGGARLAGILNIAVDYKKGRQQVGKKAFLQLRGWLGTQHERHLVIRSTR